MPANTDLETLPGVDSTTAAELKETAYDSLKAIAVCTPGEITENAGVSESTATDMIEASREKADIGGFGDTGSLFDAPPTERIKFGNDTIDELLEGGVETGAMTHFYGHRHTPRSEFAHLLAVQAQLPRGNGGVNGDVLYVDAHRKYESDRIGEFVQALPSEDRRALARKHGGSVNETGRVTKHVLEHIFVNQPSDSSDQIQCIEQAQAVCADDSDVRLLIVDGLFELFRQDYPTLKTSDERQKKLNKHLSDLSQFMETQGAAVVLINDTTTDSEPCGGGIVQDKATVSVRVNHSSTGRKSLEVISPVGYPDTRGYSEFNFTDGRLCTPK